MSIVNKVEISVNIYKLICILLFTIDIELAIINSGKSGCNSIFSAVIISVFACSSVKLVHMINYSGLHITILVKEIGLSFYNIRCARICVNCCVLVISGAVPITETICRSYPSAICNTTVIKYKLNTIISINLTVYSSKCFAIKIVPILSDSKPS